MVGQTVSHYEITEKIGEGGMGVVYKARDTKLDRTVALKFLPAEHTAKEENIHRFIREAKATSSLDHPNICTIHEINETPEGQLFIVMPAYEGETLHDKIKRSPLKIDETLDIAIQIADGLQAAHEKGIVHRDIKSSNIFITQKGQVKIMDFGLAHKSGLTQFTRTDTSVGTLPYISPEQARGDKLDHRTDIWSLGVILYEMVSARLPFVSNYIEELVYIILTKEPEPVTGLQENVPVELERIITKALRKDRDDRHQNAECILTDLKICRRNREGLQAKSMSWKSGALSLTGRYPYRIAITVIAIFAFFVYMIYSPASYEIQSVPSVVVLPFENLSSNREGSHFAAGIHDDIIVQLSKIDGLKVIAHSSALRYPDGDREVHLIGRELGVMAVLDGDLNIFNSRLQLRVRLVDVRDGAIRWAEIFDREMEHLFVVQDEIAGAVARDLGLSTGVTDDARPVRRPTQNIAAYELFLRGNDPAMLRTRESALMAKQFFKQAIDLDSTYADPYAGLARMYLRLSRVAGDGAAAAPRRDWLTLAEEAALEAVALDNSLAAAHAALGTIRLNMFEFESAESLLQHAVALDPGRALYHEYLVGLYIWAGRTQEALSAAERAMELDPLSPSANAEFARALSANGRCDEALSVLGKLTDLRPPLLRAAPIAAACYAQMEMWPEAIAEMHMVLEERNLHGHAFLGYLFARAGQKEEALAIYDSLLDRWRRGNGDAFALAIIYLGLGDLDKAFSFIEQSINDFSLSPATGAFTIMDLFFEDLHRDPRFEHLCEKLGLQNRFHRTVEQYGG